MLVEILPTSGINMAVPTFKDYLAGPTQAPVSNKQNTVSKSKTPSFGEFLASKPVEAPKKTLGQKVLNAGTAVSTFFGGKAIADKIGATIAKSKATEEEKKYIESPTNKQVAASAGELGLNIATLALGGAGGAIAKSVSGGKKALTLSQQLLNATKQAVPVVKETSKAVKLAKLTGEGIGYGAAQAGLRGVQDQKTGEQIEKDILSGGAIAGGATLALGLAGNAISRLAGKTKKPLSVQESIMDSFGKTTPNVADNIAQTVDNVAPTVETTIPKDAPVQKPVSQVSTEGIDVIDNTVPPVQEPPKIKEEWKKATDDTYESFKRQADDTPDPVYRQQVGNIRPESAAEYLAQNGVDDSINVALTKKGVAAGAGFTAPYMKEFLIKSGELNDDQIYRLLNSKASESLSGSSLQSISPLQSFINKANMTVKEASKRYEVINNKTVKTLFNGLEC